MDGESEQLREIEAASLKVDERMRDINLTDSVCDFPRNRREILKVGNLNTRGGLAGHKGLEIFDRVLGVENV